MIGAHPSMGKSALSANLAVRAAMPADQYSVAVISTDLPVKQMLMRMMALESRVDLEKLRTGQWKSHDWRQLAVASGRLSKAAVDAVFDGLLKVGLQRINDEQKDIGMSYTNVEIRYLTHGFPNLVLPKNKPVCPIEIDAGPLSDEEMCHVEDGKAWEPLDPTL